MVLKSTICLLSFSPSPAHPAPFGLSDFAWSSRVGASLIVSSPNPDEDDAPVKDDAPSGSDLISVDLCRRTPPQTPRSPSLPHPHSPFCCKYVLRVWGPRSCPAPTPSVGFSLCFSFASLVFCLFSEAVAAFFCCLKQWCKLMSRPKLDV